MFRIQNIRYPIGMPEDGMERNGNATAIRSHIFAKRLWGIGYGRTFRKGPIGPWSGQEHRHLL